MGIVDDGSSEMFLAKFDNEGNENWKKSLPMGKGYSLTVDFNNNYYITGVKNYTGSFYERKGDVFITKFNQDGEEQWTQYLEEEDNTKFSKGLGISKGDKNYIYVIALTDIIKKKDEDIKSNLLISKYHPSGTLQWTKTYKDVNIYDINAMLFDNYKIYLGGSIVRPEKVRDTDAFIM